MAGLIFTAANFLLVLGPAIYVLQICGFVPMPDSIITALPQIVLSAGALAGFAVLFPTAVLVSKLQEGPEQDISALF